MKRTFLVALLALAGAASPALAHAPLVPEVRSPVAFDGRILVRMAPGEATSLRVASRRSFARMRSTSTVLRTLSTTHALRSARPAVADALLFPEALDVGLDRWFVFEVDPAAGFDAVAAGLRAMPGVELVYQDDTGGSLQVAPNDSLFANNWGHGNTGTFPAYSGGGQHAGANVGTVGFDSNVQGGWGAPAGYGSSSMIIGIIDTGIDLTHPDLVQVQGYDALNDDDTPTDTHGHGTACAGVAAAIANNAIGVAGVAGGCSIMPLQVTDNVSFPISAFVSALAYAVTHGAKVVSISLRYNPWTQAMTDALNAAEAAGVVLCASAGNFNSGTISFPARSPKVIAVGAASPCAGRKRASSDWVDLSPGVSPDSLGVSCDNETWWGSNWGVAVKDDSAAVDILGPTMLPTTDIQGAGGFSANGYSNYFNGTSCATPYVAGVAALIRLQHPTWTPAQVRQRLMETAIDVSDAQTPVGWDKYTGYGMVNAGLPDLVPFAPGGWYAPIVPRPTADATAGSVPAPTTLSGDVNCFVSRAVTNAGEAHSGTDQGAMLLDGVQVGTLNYGLAPGFYVFSLHNALNVRGGRHTLGVFVDNNTDIDESNEVNNRNAHQWSWTPASIPTTVNGVVSRLAPPDRLGGRADVPVSETTYDNVDAVRMIGPEFGSSGQFWVMGLHASDNATDVDLGLHFPGNSAAGLFTPGTKAIGSELGVGSTEWVVWNLSNDIIDAMDATSLGVAGTGVSRFESHLSEALANSFSGSQITIPGYAFGSDMMVAVHDLVVTGGGPGPVSLELTSTAPLRMAIYPVGLTFMNRAGAAQFSVPGGSGRHTLTRTLPSGRHAVVVYRDRTDGTAALTYSIRVRRTPAELVASNNSGGFFAPSGVYKDGVGNAAAAPTVLDGNLLNTRFYYGYANTGPTAASGFTARELLDGGEVLTWTPGALNAGAFAGWISTLRQIRGGRHTMGFKNDFSNVLDEPNEVDNDHASQWVWSPLPITMGVPVSRAMPPDKNGGWSEIPVATTRYDNVDGLRTPVLTNTGDDGWWNWFAVAPRTASDDVDLAVYQPASTGPGDGFTVSAGTATLPAGRVDYVGVDAAAPRAVDLGLVKASGAGNVVAHGSRSVFIPTQGGTFGPYTLDPDELVACFEYPSMLLQRQVRLLNLSGGANLDLHIHERSENPSVIQLPADGLTAEANGDGMDEVLEFTPTTDFPAIVVTKRGTTDIGKTATFSIQLGSSTVGVPGREPLPTVVRLAPVMPNPVREAASIAFDLPRDAAVELAAYDVAGRRVATLASGAWTAGRHTVSWAPVAASGARLARGIYLLKLEADGVESVRRMVVTR